jgi:hypothetical protein
MDKLGAGDAFPEFDVETVSHGRLRIPAALASRYSVLLFYRGWW